MKTRFHLLLSLLVVFASCKKDIVVPAPSSQRTLLVFMGGDNNLSKETYDKLEALRQSATSTMGRLLVFQDVPNGGARLLEIKYGQSAKGEVTLLKTYGEVNSLDPLLFKQVLNDMASFAPSSSYGLLYFSHGSGWLPQRALTQPFDFLPNAADDAGFSALAQAIPDHFFDFIVFESCFTSGIEVLYELKDKTNFVLSSSAEIISPGFTEIYNQLLPLLYQPEADLKACAQLYFNHYNQQSSYSRSATVSVTDMKALPALADWVKQNVKGGLPADQLKDVQHFDRFYGYQLFFDFEDYYQRLSPVNSHPQLSVLLQQAVPYKAATAQFLKNYNGFDISVFSGLTSYIPQNGFGSLNIIYNNLKWTRAVAE